MTDLMLIIGLTLISCVIVGLAGIGLLHLGRLRSLRYQLTLVTVLPVVAVVAATLINVKLMFLSTHDSTVILVALSVAALLAVAGSWLVLRRVTSAWREVGRGLSLLVSDSASPAPPPSTAPEVSSARLTGLGAAPSELTEVLDDLDRTRSTLAQSRARERATEESRRELVSFMSHDLRTPLAGLRALAEALEDGVIDDVPRALAHLRGTVTRMTALVDDLFALSRVQGSAERKPETMVSLAELISDVSSELSSTARASGVGLEVLVPETDRLAVLGSSDDLARALSNLVSNAIRHTDPGGTVRVEGTRAEDGRVQVSVLDGCGGIPDDHLARVFDTGWRGTPSRTAHGQHGNRPQDVGAGLGLAITRGVVESHAGQVEVSNVAGGCQFRIELPATQSGENGRRSPTRSA